MSSRLLLSCLCAVAAASSVELDTGWRLASSSSLDGASGADISEASFDASSWLPLQAFPTTVLAALASNGTAPRRDMTLDLYFGRNLNETNTSLFDVPWWYRAPIPDAVQLPATGGSGRVLLTFRGINYRSAVWVNGVQVAGPLEGAFIYHDVDITAALREAGDGHQNILAVEVSRSFDWGLDCESVRPHSNSTVPENEQVSCRGKSKVQSTDLAITFVDWAPAPHDANLGNAEVL